MARGRFGGLCAGNTRRCRSGRRRTARVAPIGNSPRVAPARDAWRVSARAARHVSSRAGRTFDRHSMARAGSTRHASGCGPVARIGRPMGRALRGRASERRRTHHASEWIGTERSRSERRSAQLEPSKNTDYIEGDLAHTRPTRTRTHHTRQTCSDAPPPPTATKQPRPRLDSGLATRAARAPRSRP